MLLKRLVKNIAYDHEMDTTFMAKPYPGQAGTDCTCISRCSTSMATTSSPARIRAERRIAPCDRRCARDPAGLHGLPLPERQLLPPLRFAVLRAERAELGPGQPHRGPARAHRRPTRYAWNIAWPVPTPTPTCYWQLVLAGVHHGLTNKVEPGAPIEGNSYEQMEPSLPNNLRDALRELDESEIMASTSTRSTSTSSSPARKASWRFEYSISDLEYTTGTCMPSEVGGIGAPVLGRRRTHENRAVSQTLNAGRLC